MLVGLLKVAGSRNGRLAISFLLGFGVATLFRRTCSERGCIVFRAPHIETAAQRIYEYGGKCVKFSMAPESCERDKKIVDAA